jgi:hypothetical protein
MSDRMNEFLPKPVKRKDVLAIAARYPAKNQKAEA